MKPHHIMAVELQRVIGVVIFVECCPTRIAPVVKRPSIPTDTDTDAENKTRGRRNGKKRIS